MLLSTPERRALVCVTGAVAFFLPLVIHANPIASQARGQATPPPPTLGLDHGTLDFDTPDFTLKLVKDSQTIAALEPKGAKGIDANTPFDFTPADQLTARQGDRFNHLGDITLRDQAGRLARRRVGRLGVEQRAQAGHDRCAGRSPAAGSRVLAAADLTPTLPADAPLQDHRARGGSMRPAVSCCTSTCTNTSQAPVDDRRPRIPGRVQQHDSELRDQPRAHAAAGARDLLVLRSLRRPRRRLSASHAPVRRRPRARRRARSRARRRRSRRFAR